jgi:hypothetical protein
MAEVWKDNEGNDMAGTASPIADLNQQRDGGMQLLSIAGSYLEEVE